MKKLFSCLLLTLLCSCDKHGMATAEAAAAVPHETFEAECERRLNPTDIKVQALPSEIHYNFVSSMAQLTSKGSRQRQLGQVVLGLTEARLSYRLNWGANYLVEQGTGRACMRPRLTLVFDVNPQLVSVAREFPKGSCAFNEIATHELRHVNANQAQLQTAADMMQRELTTFFGQKVFYGSKSALQAQWQDALSSSWMPLAKAELAKVDIAHNAIDSPEEYARNRTICNGAITQAVVQAGLAR
jgi:hypothetical protein